MKPRDIDKEKELAAHHSVSFIKNGMVVGLGTGSTSTYMIRKLGDEVAKGLSMQGVPSSERSAQLAREVGIPLTTLAEVGKLDINIDGADEFDDRFRLIKGGGGALLREKILAYNAKFNVIITDSGKYVKKLGGFKLPVETIPFATQNIITQFLNMNLKPVLRKHNGKSYRTDENNFIIDIDIWEVEDVNLLNSSLIDIPGVVETGLFLNTTDVIVMGNGDDTTVYTNKIPRNNR